MTPRAYLYLLLSIAGLALTWSQNLQFINELGAGATPLAFVEGVYANHASASIGWDITVAAAACLVWMHSEAKRLGMRHAWVFLPLTLLVALAFAWPLFLCLRERKIAAGAAAD